MNANEFFENHSIEEINKKTKISPISLRYIKNKEFEKIQRVKFLGFIRIIEKEYKIDLSELIDEYNNSTNHTETENNIAHQINEPKTHNTLIISILAFILLALGGYLLYKKFISISNKQNLKESYTIIKNEKNITSNVENYTEENNIFTTENNNTNENDKIALEQNATNIKNNIEKNTTQIINKKPLLPQNIKIIPNKKVWFRAINLDTKKSVEYLTSNPKTLNGPNWYIKFGHGYVNINYGDKNITPNTKKIVRILFKDGNITYLKKQNRYEK